MLSRAENIGATHKRFKGNNFNNYGTLSISSVINGMDETRSGTYHVI
jgi:hypothetical protein